MTTSRPSRVEPGADPALLYQGEEPYDPWVPATGRIGTAETGDGAGAETAAARREVDADAADDPAGQCATADGIVGVHPHDVDLPVWLRVTLIVIGVLLIVVGVAGLVLPGLQGILTILLGLALLSLVSHQAHRFLHWSLGPWPKMRDKVDGYRQRCYEWLNDKVGYAGTSAVGAEEAAAAETPIPGPAPHLNLETRRVGDAASVAQRDGGRLDETLDLVCGDCTGEEGHTSVAPGGFVAADLPRAS